MNIAVDPDRRRRGIASTLLARAVRARRRPRCAVHARGAAAPTPARSRSTSRFGFRAAGVAAPLLPGQRRGRADHVAHAGDAARLARRRARRHAALILGARDLAATTPARRSSRAPARCCANVVSSQGVHDRFGGVVPEIASRHHLELVNAVVDDALARAGTGSTTSSPSPSRRGPGWSARCSSASRPPRGSPPRGGSRSRRSTTCRATSPRTSSRRTRSSRRSCA